MKKAVDVSIVFIALVFLVLTLQTLQSLLRPLTLSMILALLIVPLWRTLKASKIPTGLGLFIIFAGLALGIYALTALVPTDLTFSVDSLQTWWESSGYDSYIPAEKIASTATLVVQSVLSAIGTIFSEMLLVLLFFGFIISSYDGLIGKAESLAPNKKAIHSIVRHMEQSIRDYMGTKVLVSLGTAVLSSLVMIAFVPKLALIAGLLIFTLNFIPNVGSFIAVAISLLLAAVSLGVSTSLIILAALLIVIQFIFGNIVEPKLAGAKLKLSPLVILMGLLFWGWVWGIVGMLLAVPLTSITKIVLSHIKSTKKIAWMME